jgi:ADP-heptose:LPS heptosyltransferase
MASISHKPLAELARAALASALASEPQPSEDLSELVRGAACDSKDRALEVTRTFFRDLVEPLCDLFDPAATRAYTEVFAAVAERLLPGHSAPEILNRYARVRSVGRYSGSPKRICVLSRVTLGADVAVTSVVLAAAKERFQGALICFVGPAKNAELFACDSRVKPISISYGRSALLKDRLLAAEEVRAVVDDPDTLVIDPDSRLTQLGLLPVCDEKQYLFFESRSYAPESPDPLPVLTARWIEETLGVRGLAPYLAPPTRQKTADVTVSLGVGENPAKRVSDDFEYEAVRALLAGGRTVIVDRGSGGEEASRVDRLAERLANKNLFVHDGSFASFASHILQSRLYFGYDSAGQHVAAAGAVPLVAVFAGYASERTYQRWTPWGRGRIKLIKIDDANRPLANEIVLNAIAEAAAQVAEEAR